MPYNRYPDTNFVHLSARKPFPKYRLSKPLEYKNAQFHVCDIQEVDTRQDKIPRNVKLGRQGIECMQNLNSLVLKIPRYEKKNTFLSILCQAVLRGKVILNHLFVTYPGQIRKTYYNFYGESNIEQFLVKFFFYIPPPLVTFPRVNMKKVLQTNFTEDLVQNNFWFKMFSLYPTYSRVLKENLTG